MELQKRFYENALETTHSEEGKLADRHATKKLIVIEKNGVGVVLEVTSKLTAEEIADLIREEMGNANSHMYAFARNVMKALDAQVLEKTAENNKPYEYDNITNLECLAEYGVKAKQFTSSLLRKDVYIEFDESAGLRGYYGRLLAYIYYNGDDFTAELVKKGYARVHVEENCKKNQEYL